MSAARRSTAEDPASAASPWRAARLVAWVLAASVAMFTTPALAVEEAAVPATERSIKAAYLYKFLSYVDWPETAFSAPDAPMVIGVLSAEDVAAELAQITSARTINGRPVVVRRLRETDSMAGLHVLFVGRAESGRLQPLLRSVRERPILTVAEIPGAIESGAMINFVLVGGRVRFEIAVDAAERSGLKLSSRLLAVAQNVRTGP